MTTFFAEDLSWGGLVRGLMVLGVLWWAWAAFAWLTNAMAVEEGAGRLVIFVAMGGMLIASLAVPGAFAAEALVFALSIAVVRIAHLAAYVVGSGEPVAIKALFDVRDCRGARFAREAQLLSELSHPGIVRYVTHGIAPAGALFLVMALGQWRKRPKPGEQAEMPKWMAMIDRFNAGKSLGLGAVLSGANPKNLALTLAASATIAPASRPSH